MCNLFIYFFQIEEIRNSIDKIDENVAEVKKLYSVILSAPTSDQSKTHTRNYESECSFRVIQWHVCYKYSNSFSDLVPFFFLSRSWYFALLSTTLNACTSAEIQPTLFCSFVSHKKFQHRVSAVSRLFKRSCKHQSTVSSGSWRYSEGTLFIWCLIFLHQHDVEMEITQ